MDIEVREDLLAEYGAQLLSFDKGDMIFAQGDGAPNFYSVRSGRVKMMHFNEQGREFVQGYFLAGESFGEPPFFAKLAYPASAVAAENSEVWRIGYDRFMRLVREHPGAAIKVIEALSYRLIYKSIMLSETAIEEAEHRIATLLKYIKKDRGVLAADDYVVELTRQELSELTGLRVETVIRTLKKMEGKGLVKIVDRKLLVLASKTNRNI